MIPKPLILAVETSGRAGSAAIAVGEQILAEAAFSGPMRHSAEIFPTVSALLKDLGRKPKEIEHIYISIGPGSFTGLRIAVTIAKTFNLANNAKIVPVDTLDVIAANVTTENTLPTSSHEPPASLVRHSFSDGGSIEHIAAILDAKRSQFFIALYQRNTSDKPQATCASGTSDGIWEKVFPDSLITAPQFLEQFACKEKPIWLLGEGLVYYRDKFKADGIHFLNERYWTPRAEKVHLLGWKLAVQEKFANPLTLQPTYLRKPDVKAKRN
jgi:tRNA threonylcarbamoyladenosine biosynthesis protein TsaB